MTSWILAHCWDPGKPFLRRHLVLPVNKGSLRRLPPASSAMGVMGLIILHAWDLNLHLPHIGIVARARDNFMPLALESQQRI